MDLATWYQGHKTEAAVGGAAAVGGLALYLRSRSSASSTAAPASTTATTTTSALDPTSTYDSTGIDQYDQLASAISNANDQISTLSTQVASNAAAQVAPAPSPFNPYPVGTTLNPGVKIIQSVPVGNNGWVNVGSTGGLFTSPGLAVNGSAFGTPAPPGGFSALVNGNTVYEDTGTGVKTFNLLGG